MTPLHLSALLIAEGVVTREQLDELRAGLSEETSIEDVLLERGLVDQETLDRLSSLAKTPLPVTGGAAPEDGQPTDRNATMWEYEVPHIEGDDEFEGEVSQDAVTGRYEKPSKSTTARWVETPIESTGKLKGRTTRWEIPIPEENPTGEWLAPRKSGPRGLDLSGLESEDMGTTSIGGSPEDDDESEPQD